MHKLMLSSLAITLTLALGLSGCQSLDILNSDGSEQTKVKDAEVGVSENKVEDAKAQYESAPDLTNAQILGGLSSDAMGPYDMSTNPEAVRQGVALSGRLESAPLAHNTMLGVADPYSSVSEIELEDVSSDDGELLKVANPQASVVPTQSSYPQPNSVRELGSLSSCSTKLNIEANGLARSLVKELALRLRNEGGNIYVAPTIIDNEYQDCIDDLSTALQDGLVGSSTFSLVSATTNLNNIISQNIGSATILPNLIHQCRASAIPYLVVSQVKKAGDKAALTIRIIRTEDGITLSQTFRRLHN